MSEGFYRTKTLRLPLCIAILFTTSFLPTEEMDPALILYHMNLNSAVAVRLHSNLCIYCFYYHATMPALLLLEYLTSPTATDHSNRCILWGSWSDKNNKPSCDNSILFPGRIERNVYTCPLVYSICKISSSLLSFFLVPYFRWTRFWTIFRAFASFLILSCCQFYCSVPVRL